MAIETKIEQLENIVKALDDEKDIEKAMKLFNDGVVIINECKEYLEKSNENVLKVEKVWEKNL